MAFNLKTRTARALGATVVANVFNQIVVILTQLVIVPIIALKWGAAGLGTWMTLTALPTYLSISDLGFTYSAKSDMSIRMSAKDVDGARITSSSTFVLLIASFTVLGAIYGACVALVDWEDLLNLVDISIADTRAVLMLGLLQVFAFQLFLLSSASVRASGHPALEASLDAFSRALETTALGIAVFMGGGFLEAAAAWSLTRVACTALIWTGLYIKVPQLMPHWRFVRWDRIKALFHPSVAYLVIPLANAILIQGVVILVGVTTGPIAVAAYSLARIVTRMGVSAANVLNYAFVPQYSYLVGNGDKGGLWKLYKIHNAMIIGGTLLYIATIALLGNFALSLLSHGKVDVSTGVLVFLTMAAAAEMLWTPSLSLDSASNDVGRVARRLLFYVLVSVGIGYVFSHTYGDISFAAAVALCHMLMCVYAARRWLRARGEYAELKMEKAT